MSSSKKLLQSASGFIDQSGSLNVEDVFSTFVYTGSSSSQTISNGIDLSGEGGMVWYRRRDGAENNSIEDTVRGLDKVIYTDSNNGEGDPDVYGIQAFNSNGFTAGQGTVGGRYISWTFRKAKNFFDVVTYNGSSSAQTIAHNLGSVPGMIIIKQTNSSANDWKVYHRSVGNTKVLELNTNGGAYVNSSWNNTTPTATHFTVGTVSGVNASGSQYVAYLFAHDTSDEGLIQCGTYTASASGVEIDLGFEPQWLMVKRINSAYSWYIMDIVRGFTVNADPKTLKPNESEAEGSLNAYRITNTGFEWGSDAGEGSDQYIYMAIRRGPMATPTSRANVFALDTVAYTGSNSWTPAFGTTNLADFVIVKNRSTTEDIYAGSRLMGVDYVVTNSNATEASGSSFIAWDYMAGAWVNAQNNGRGAYIWSRAPGFCDVVTWTGNGSAGRQISHNLSVSPEMIWCKLRDTYTDNWMVYHSGLATNNNLILDRTDATGIYTRVYSPSETIFTISSDTSINSNGLTYIAYLFATLAGISKVGTFSHTNGSTTDVNCGFSSGTYWVVVKRKDSTGDWFVFDVGANIGASNDPYIALNSNAAAVTTPNYIAQLNSGFTMESDFPTGDYIFYAIAN